MMLLPVPVLFNRYNHRRESWKSCQTIVHELFKSLIQETQHMAVGFS
jgi:hypothetical protein